MLTICLSDTFKVIQALCDLKINEFKKDVLVIIFFDLSSPISTVSGGGVDKLPRGSECNKGLTLVRVSSTCNLS